LWKGECVVVEAGNPPQRRSDGSAWFQLQPDSAAVAAPQNLEDLHHSQRIQVTVLPQGGDPASFLFAVFEVQKLIPDNLSHDTVLDFQSLVGKIRHEDRKNVFNRVGAAESGIEVVQPEDIEKVVHFAINSIGAKYDLKNVIDLTRYLLPTPPVPVRWRRRLLALGSGDPTRAICSTLIAQAFQLIGYPILPEIKAAVAPGKNGDCYTRECLHIRHHSLYTPRDFDVSPYFEIVKPTTVSRFDYKALTWADERPKHKPLNPITDQ